MHLKSLFACLLAVASITPCLADAAVPTARPLKDAQADAQVTQLLKKALPGASGPQEPLF